MTNERDKEILVNVGIRCSQLSYDVMLCDKCSDKKLLCDDHYWKFVAILDEELRKAKP